MEEWEARFAGITERLSGRSLLVWFEICTCTLLPRRTKTDYNEQERLTDFRHRFDGEVFIELFVLVHPRGRMCVACCKPRIPKQGHGGPFCFTNVSRSLVPQPVPRDGNIRKVLDQERNYLVNYVGKASSLARQIQILGFGVLTKGLWVWYS